MNNLKDLQDLYNKQFAFYRNKLIYNNQREMVKLGEVVDFYDKQREFISKDKRIKGDFPYYGANGVIDYVDHYGFDGEFLLLGSVGSCIRKDNTPILNLAKGKFVSSESAYVIKGKEDIVLTKYIYFCLCDVNVKALVSGYIPNIRKDQFSAIRIPMCPFEEQKAIVKKLDELEEKIMLINSTIEKENTLMKKFNSFFDNFLLSFEWWKGLSNERI